MSGNCTITAERSHWHWLSVDHPPYSPYGSVIVNIRLLMHENVYCPLDSMDRVMSPSRFDCHDVIIRQKLVRLKVHPKSSNSFLVYLILLEYIVCFKHL